MRAGLAAGVGLASGGAASPGGGRRETMKHDQHLPESLHFIRVLWRLEHAMNKRSRRMLKELGVTAQQRFLLKVLALRPGSSPGELAKVLHVTPATVTRVVQRLEDAGYLGREVDPSDSRKLRLHLTPKGRKVDEVGDGPGHHPVTDVISKLPAARVEETRQLLEAVIRSLEAR